LTHRRIRLCVVWSLTTTACTFADKNIFSYLLAKENQAGKTNSQVAVSLWCVPSSDCKSWSYSERTLVLNVHIYTC